MKTRMLIAMAVLMLGFASCNKKENVAEPDQFAVEASKTSKIKIGEPVNFNFTGASDSSAVLWTVEPFTGVQINSTGNTASILFNNAGSYRVNATLGQVRGSTSVSVLDSIYNPGGGGTPTYEPLTGDQIFITVSKMDSMGITGLDFRYITANKYPCLNHTLVFDNNFSGQDLQVVFTSVFIPAKEYCAAGEDFATGGTAWYPIADGSHGLEVVLDGTTYTGSFIKSGSTFTFTWPYSSGVTLTPLVLN